MAKEPDRVPPWHSLSPEQAAERLEVDRARGLDDREAERRRQRYGANELEGARRRGPLAILVAQFRDVLVAVLVTAAAISLWTGDEVEAVAILAIVILNAALGAVQEYRADRALQALRRMSGYRAKALRSGAWRSLSSEELVPGDVVEIEAGSVAPADLRLSESFELRVDESMLSGESMPVEKQTAALADPRLDQTGLALFDRTNMVFRGTSVTHGRALGLVAETGMTTEMGRIAKLLPRLTETPLQKRLARFGRHLALIVLVVCALIFAAGLARGEPLGLMFLTAVSLAVAAIPEALPAVVTIALALGAQRMVRKKALLRNLPAAEALGSVTVICADKTGTLTQNRMRVEELFVADRGWIQATELEGAIGGAIPKALPPSSPAATEPSLDSGSSARLLLTTLALSNDVVGHETPGRENSGAEEFDRGEAQGEAEKIAGDPTEVALVEAAVAAGVHVADLARRLPRIGELPFDSERKRMATLHRDAEGVLVLVKGAPESVIEVCDHEPGPQGEASKSREAWLREAGNQARLGRRVIAFAFRRLEDLPLTLEAGQVERDLTFLGLASLMDPPRPEAGEAVALCRSAGIRPVMITGDHPATAEAIARRLGILDPENDSGDNTSEQDVLTGAALAVLDAETKQRRILDTRVFARVTAEQKIDIVSALQDSGELVAMTGDGVNDAPALRRADIGVAMGKKGTDVAREASDMVLLDDNFSTIVSAVREGRRIFDNIRKFVRYTMTSNSGEIWTLGLAPLFGLPLPLLPVQILWINLVTDGLPGLALAIEPEEPGLMDRKPRAPSEPVLAGMVLHILIIGLLIAGLSLGAMFWAYQSGSESWRSVVFTVLTFCQLAHALAVRSERRSISSYGLLSNRPLLGAIALTVALQLAVVYLPPLQRVFATRGMSVVELAVCCVVPVVVLLAVEAEKWWLRRRAA